MGRNFARIKAGFGFNSIILVIPWREFQPGIWEICTMSRFRQAQFVAVSEVQRMITGLMVTLPGSVMLLDYRR